MSEKDYKLFGLTSEATPEAVQSAWKKIRSSLHPDKGGGAGEFSKYLKAYQRIMEEKKLCDICCGEGKMVLWRAGGDLTMTCPKCNGRGCV